jgi:hypothetical protein
VFCDLAFGEVFSGTEGNGMRAAMLMVFMSTIAAIATVAGAASADVWNNNLSRGHNILFQRGLQIQASCNYLDSTFNLTNWNASHFTTVHFWGNYPQGAMPAAPVLPWAISDVVDSDISPSLAAYGTQLISYQMGDEQDITGATAQASLRSAMAAFHVNRPNVITYTNQWGSQISATAMQTYMQNVKPDMVMFDTYPFTNGVTGGSPTGFYGDLQKYRKLGLAGNDGTGARPIPTGFWTQTCDVNHTISESEIRLNNFSGWAFGFKVATAYRYWPGLLFSGAGTDTPTTQFNQVAETNRQSLNLGPALVRLVSTDVRMTVELVTCSNSIMAAPSCPSRVQCASWGLALPQCLHGLSKERGQ